MIKLPIPVANGLSNLGSQAIDVKKAFTEILEYKKEIKRLDNEKELRLEEIEKKYDLYYQVFAAIFSERKSIIDKYFEIIDQGIKNNDSNLISHGIAGLSEVVRTSPISNFDNFSKAIEAGETIKL